MPALPIELQRRARLLLALRAAGLVVIALGAPRLLAGLIVIASDPAPWVHLSDRRYAVTARVLLLFSSIAWDDVARWMMHFGTGLLGCVAGLYLLFRTPSRLLRAPRKGRPA